MEGIKELRKICQAPRASADNWHMKHIARAPSIYITWLLLHTPLSADGATLLMTIVGLAACAVFMSGTAYSFFIGSLMLQLWYIMDMVDGEIARYRRKTSLTGLYFDWISHYLVHPLVFVAIGMGLSRSGGKVVFYASLVAAYSVMMISVLWDVLQSLLYTKLVKDPRLAAKVSAKQKEERTISFARRIFSMLHVLSTFPSIMNMLLIVAALQVIFIRPSFLHWFVYFYAVAATLVWILRLVVFLLQKRADKELA